MCVCMRQGDRQRAGLVSPVAPRYLPPGRDPPYSSTTPPAVRMALSTCAGLSMGTRTSSSLTSGQRWQIILASCGARGQRQELCAQTEPSGGRAPLTKSTMVRPSEMQIQQFFVAP